jgi:uncharacterized membrane protein YvbJ
MICQAKNADSNSFCYTCGKDFSGVFFKSSGSSNAVNWWNKQSKGSKRVIGLVGIFCIGLIFIIAIGGVF